MPHGNFANDKTVRISAADKGEPVLAKSLNGQFSSMTPPEANVQPNDIGLSAAKAFYMATLGSAKALNLDDKIGNFKKGKEADFLVIDMSGSRQTKTRMAHVKAKGGINAKDQ